MLIHNSDTPDRATLKVKNHLKKTATGNNREMRFFSISSIDMQTHTVSSRMVVLRKFYPDWTVRFYTDNRTKKVSEIEQCPKVSLLFWDPTENLQVRLKAEAIIHNRDEPALKEWTEINKESRKQYTSILKPGTVIPAPEKAFNWPENYHSDYFSVVDCTPFDIEILQLNSLEHLSLKFSRINKDSEWKGGWIVP